MIDPNKIRSAILILIVFVAVLWYGATSRLAEAAICSGIFFVCLIFELFGFRRTIFREYARLLYPLYGLAAFSLLQGLLTVGLNPDDLSDSGIFSIFSYDLTSSIWVAVKIIAFAAFLRMLLSIRVDRKVLIWGACLVGNFFALFSLLRYAAHSRLSYSYFLLPELTADVGFGSYYNQNHFAFFLLMVLGLNLGIIVYGELRIRGRFLLLVLTLLVWSAIVLTTSRAGIISSFVVVTALIFIPTGASRLRNSYGNGKKSFGVYFKGLARRFVLLVFISFSLLLGVILIGGDVVIHRFNTLPFEIDSTDVTTGYRRVDAYSAAIEIVKARPLFGVGFGGYQYAVSKYIDISGYALPKQAHNDYLELAACGGVVALLLAFWFVFGLGKLLRTSFKKRSGLIPRSARLGALCGFAGIAVHSFFDFGFQIPSNALFAGLLIAIALPNGSIKSSKEPSNISDTLRKTGSLSGFVFPAVLIVMLIFSVTFGLSRLTSLETFWDRGLGFRLPFDSEQAEQNAEIALRKGDITTAKRLLHEAIEIRPMDYALMLRLGEIQILESDVQGAADSLKKSIHLAPFYARPKFVYGKLLLAQGEKESALKQLSAAKRNIDFYEQIAKIVWNESGKDGFRTIQFMAPTTYSEFLTLNKLFAEKDSLEYLVPLYCNKKDDKYGFYYTGIATLLENRRYRLAALLEQESCDLSAIPRTNFENGNFEAEIGKERTDFNWNFEHKPNNVSFSLEKTDNLSFGFSLKLTFDGASDPERYLFSQLIFADNAKEYELRFDSKDTGFLEGTLPELIVEALGPESEPRIVEIVGMKSDGKWATQRIRIRLGQNEEGLKISLRFAPCKYDRCPVFGNLWLDNFSITQVKSLG